MSRPLHRRQVLQGLGGFTLSIPMLPSLLTSPRAFADATSARPLRMVAIMSVNGQFASSYWPGADPTEQVAPGVYGRKLEEIAGPMSPIMGTFFDNYRRKMNVVRGLDHVGWGDHNDSIFLTASSYVGNGSRAPLYGASIDTMMEESSLIYPTEPEFRALRVAHDYFYRMPSYKRVNGKAVVSSALTSDAALFNYVFSKFNAPPATADKVKMQKLSAIDRVFPQYKELINNRRISSEDKQRLQQHFDTLATAQKKIAQSEIKACEKPAFTAWKRPLNQHERYFNINNILVSSFACDLTRLAVISIPDFNDNYNTSHSDYHGNSHNLETNVAAATKSAEYNRWVGQVVADLMAKMDGFKEADGSSMLDNSIIFWGNEISYGNDHRPECLPLITAGGAGGKMKTGYYLDYRKRPLLRATGNFPGVGVPYSQFLAGVMLSMGLPASEFRPKWGAADGLFGQFSPPEFAKAHYEPYRSKRDQALPFLFNV